MKLNNFFKLIIAVGISELAGIIGSFFTISAIPTWYAGLAKPALNPPAWAFGPAWTTLYFLMGVAAFLVWRNGLERKEVRRALTIFGGQLFLNAIWSIIFFGLHNPFWAFAEIIVLWLAILWTIFAFYKISRPAAYLLLPYVLWVSFAGYLNYSIWQLNPSAGLGQVACTQEAKLCSGGSYVSRTGPNCEFAECPSDNSELSSNFSNDQVERAITNYLLTQKHFSWKTRNDSHNFCAVENLKPENELFPLYVWAYCGEYIIQNGELKTLSGSSGPAEIDYPNELSFYDLSKFSYEAPGDGSHYAEDIRRMFPEDIWQHIFDFDRGNIIKRNENTAFTNISSWELVKQAINNCEVKVVWQTHDRKVEAKLKNGEELAAVEPKLDDIIDLAIAAEPECGKILMGTE